MSLISTQLYFHAFLGRCDGVGGHHEGVGGLEELLGEVAGGIGGCSGEIAGSIGGKGEEFYDQHVGKVWRFEEGGDRNGGSGMDSPEESLGMEGIGRIRHGGIDKVEDCGNRLGDCRVDFEDEGCVLKSED